MTRSSDAILRPLRSPGFLSRRAPARMSPARAASLGPVTTPRAGGRNPRRQLETSQARVMPTYSHSALMVVRRASVGESRSHHGPVKRSVVDLVRFIWAFAIAAANFCSKILCRRSLHEKLPGLPNKAHRSSGSSLCGGLSDVAWAVADPLQHHRMIRTSVMVLRVHTEHCTTVSLRLSPSGVNNASSKLCPLHLMHVETAISASPFSAEQSASFTR
jgi:hypothetical protein